MLDPSYNSAMRTARAFKERDMMLSCGDDIPEVERCRFCDEPTGNSGGDDSLYGDRNEGPYCQSCWDKNYPDDDHHGESSPARGPLKEGGEG